MVPKFLGCLASYSSTFPFHDASRIDSNQHQERQNLSLAEHRTDARGDRKYSSTRQNDCPTLYRSSPVPATKDVQSKKQNVDGLGAPSSHPRSLKDRRNRSVFKSPFGIRHFCQTYSINTARNFILEVQQDGTGTVTHQGTPRCSHEFRETTAQV